MQAPNSCKSEVFVAGVDLVLRQTGLCLLDSAGFHVGILNTKKLRGRRRLAYIRDELRERIIAPGPALVVVEGYSIMSENRPFDMGEVGSILKILTYDAGIPLLAPAPRQLKKFVTGSGTASKKQMIKCVAKYYGVKTDIDDIADAVGLAKIGEVYLTGNSNRRCELEIVYGLKNPKKPKKVRYKKNRVSV